MTLGPVGQTIVRKLEAALDPLYLEVIDESHQHEGHAGAHPSGESHFRVRVVSGRFAGQGRLSRHRAINSALAEELLTRVHALAIETWTTEEKLVAAPLAATDPNLLALLKAESLPTDGLDAAKVLGINLPNGRLAAAGAVQFLAPYALLRSLVVDASCRGKGLGSAMVRVLLNEAGTSGATEAFLLTTSAAPFFSRHGFEPIARSEVPAPIAGTSQFTGSACATAQAMRFRLSEDHPAE
jgi:BolA protein